MGNIYTFYSYKGGVGRTMALANVAVLLAQWSYKVLIVDWDLEAPGLENFFREYIDFSKVLNGKGVIDLMESVQNKTSENKIRWNDFIFKIRLPNVSQELHLITAGKRDNDYFKRVHNFDIDNLYSENNGGKYIEYLRNKWKSMYDFVLIDSRTGITDVGGICTIHLPDIVILLFGANKQNLDGIIDVAAKVKESRQKLPTERLNLVFIPIPSRFDTKEEYATSQKWLDIFADRLKGLYSNWLPRDINVRDFIEITKLPYIPYFSFGEKLPILEQGTTDPAGLGYAYENISALIAHNIESVEQLVNERDKYISEVAKTKERLMEYEKQKKEFSKDGSDYVKRLDRNIEAYIDIETTGLSPEDTEIIIIGIYRVSSSGKRFIQLFGEDITAKKLLQSLRGVDTIITYNGSRFDLPFIKQKLGIDLTKTFKHFDLMFECWQRQLFGGLKSVEAQLGVKREVAVTGYDILKHWYHYVDKKDQSSLNIILNSNKRDVESLFEIRNILAHRVSLTTQNIIEKFGLLPLAGPDVESIDPVTYVKELIHRNDPRDVKTILRLTKPILHELIIETIKNLNQRKIIEQVPQDKILSEAEKYILQFEPLIQKIEQFALISVQELWKQGVTLSMDLVSEMISTSRIPISGQSVRFNKGAPELLALRILCLCGALAFHEDSFDILGKIFKDPLEVEEHPGKYTNLPLIQRPDLFHSEAVLGSADMTYHYIKGLWPNIPYIGDFFNSEKEYHLALCKFFMLYVLAAPEKYGHPAYPGYRLISEARGAMSSFCSRLAASKEYLDDVARSIGESGSHLSETWPERIKKINQVNLGSGYLLFDSVLFPETIESEIPE